MATSYRHEYVSSGFIAFEGELIVFVVNRGSTEEVVWARGYHRNTLDFDSDVNIHPELGPPDGRVKPGEMWAYQWQFRSGYVGGPYSVRIRTTSRALVPSIEILRHADGLSTSGHCWPGDFAVYDLPHLFDPGTAPDVEPPLVNR